MKNPDTFVYLVKNKGALCPFIRDGGYLETANCDLNNTLLAIEVL